MMVAPQVSTDILFKGKNIGTLCILTDGAWVWPGDIAYYVENYNILLPDEFIENVIKNNGIINNDIDICSLAF